MGDIKTKKRNHMLTNKLRDVAFVKTELCQVQAANQMTQKRLKRQFGNKETTSNVAAGLGRLEDEEVAWAVEDPGASDIYCA
jgi:hypothetical protein